MIPTTIGLISRLEANDASGAAAAGGGILFLGGLTILAFIIGLVWLFFPFVIFSKLNKVIYALDILNHNIRVLAKEADARAAADGRSLPPKSAHQEPTIER
jgi:hypothetical protein